MVIVLAFPLISVIFGAAAAALLVLVWVKTGMRTGKWLWWNPVAVPLTQIEGAFMLSAALLFCAGVLVIGYEGFRLASGEKELLTGYIWQHMRSGEPSRRPIGSRSVNYSDPAMQQQLKDELANAGIPYQLETTDGKEHVVWTPEHNAAVDEIQRKIVAGPSAGGRNVHFGDAATQQEFKDWLIKRGIPYEIVITRGDEFVVWKEGSKDLAMQFMKERSVPCPGDAAASAPKTGEQKPC